MKKPNWATFPLVAPDLLDVVVAAHGGLDRWRQLSTASAHVAAGGSLWTLKRQDGVMASTGVTVDLRRQRTVHERFAGRAGLRSVFTPGRVTLEDHGAVVEERRDPRSAFTGHHRDTPWDRLHVAYFAGYAMWTYLTTPFAFTGPGFSTRELDPHREDGETWRRLEVTFPDHIATHCRVQVFHVDDRGLVRRHDYVAEVVGGGPAAHYTSGHRDVDGVVVPTRRRVHPLDPDGTPLHEVTLVALDLDAITFT
jgi:hypothetical protein